MTRTAARTRLDAAIAALRARGWTKSAVEAALNGLHREDAVHTAERLAAGAAC